jgi:hypothetical protein
MVRRATVLTISGYLVHGSMGSRIALCSLFALLMVAFGRAQSSKSQVVFNSREYRAVGPSTPQSWGLTLPDRQKVQRSSDVWEAISPHATRGLARY